MSSAYLQILKERGVGWVFNRSLYSLKLKTLNMFPATEKLYEKKIPPVSRIDMFSVNVPELKRFLSELSPEEKKSIIADADNACNGTVKCFSSTQVNYKNPIDWQLNPLTGKACDKDKKWFTIPDFEPERGDIKVVWEISRFSHFFILARAFLLTENIKYVDAFKTQLSDWIKNNPYSYGANYKCGQECSLRMMSCLLVLPVFADFLDEKDENNVKELVGRCYKKILSNFFYAYRCQKNNHAVSEAVGMIVGSWCCRDEARLKKAYKILDKIIDNQFTADGGYVQQSFNYQRLALQDIEAALSASRKTGLCLSDNSLKKIKLSVLQMYQCQDESGDMPNYGANDGALIFPVTSCGYRDFRPVVNTVYALLTNSRMINSGIYDEELYWFGGEKALPAKGIHKKSSAFPETGLYTLRNEKFWAMIVSKSKTNHMDQNHIDIWADGINVLCDSGTYSYADDKGRELFSTKAHNTAFCGKKEQINRLGFFAVYGQPERLNIKADEAEVKSIVKFKSGYTHSRTVTITDKGFVLTDEIDGDEKCGITFNTPCDVKLTQNEATLYNNQKSVCRIKTDAELSDEHSQISLFYMQMLPAERMYLNAVNKKIITNMLMGENNDD